MRYFCESVSVSITYDNIVADFGEGEKNKNKITIKHVSCHQQGDDVVHLKMVSVVLEENNCTSPEFRHNVDID